MPTDIIRSPPHRKRRVDEYNSSSCNQHPTSITRSMNMPSDKIGDHDGTTNKERVHLTAAPPLSSSSSSSLPAETEAVGTSSSWSSAEASSSFYSYSCPSSSSPSMPSSPLIRQEDIADSHFRREDMLGQGTYSIVFSAVHKATNTLVALKDINRQQLRRMRLEGQLQWEINVHRQLRHANIVRLYSYYVSDYGVHLVMELCPGGTVADALKRSDGGRLRDRVAATYARHVARALHHLHHCGIAHRDLKLENVLIDGRGVAKLADFGWSRRLQHGASDAVSGGGGGSGGLAESCKDKAVNNGKNNATGSTEENDGTDAAAAAEGRLTVCGTLDYLSPEMVGGQPHSSQTDVWSLGVMIAEMLTGHPPFYHTEQRETLRAICTQPPRLAPLETATATAARTQDDAVVVTDMAADLIRSMLCKDPSARPTMSDVLRHPWLAK